MDCTNWLRDFIGGESAPSKYVSASAKAAGFTRAELKQARKDLGIKTEHRYIGDQKEEAWYWTFPREET